MSVEPAPKSQQCNVARQSRDRRPLPIGPDLHAFTLLASLSLEDAGRSRTRRASRPALVRLLLSLLLFTLGWTVHAQERGTVSGVVLSTWDGAPLSSVVVTVRGTTLATQTGLDGRYSLTNVPPGDQVLRFSKSGFASAVVTDVRVLISQATTVNGNLRPEFYELEEYEVTAEEFAEQTEKIMIERQKSSVMVEALGSDFLRRVGAANAAESIAKVSGATVVEGKFAVVRGLNDRYVTTTLNGASIPSADPYRQTASLDMFPAQVIDRVVVSKTFTPDQPGTFTGGGIDIVTKSFPEKPFLSGSIGGAYNTQASLNDRFLTYKGGGLDWAGMDDGTRALPGNVKFPVPPAPVLSGSTSNPALFRRNLDNALQVDASTRAMGVTEFAPHREAPPLNQNFSLAGGGSTHLFDGLLGYFAGVSYKHEYWFYENGISRRYWSGTETNSSYRDSRSLSVVNWSGMANLAYRPFENHELGFTFLYNQNGTDDSRVQDNGFSASDTTSVFRKFNLYYTERNLNAYQLKGEHHFPVAGGLQFNWLAALTETTQDEPDARFFNDFNRSGGGFTTGNPAPTPSNPTRYFRNLEELNKNLKLDWTLPFSNWTDETGKFKFGFFDSYSKRNFTEHQIYYQGGGGYDDDPNLYLNADNLGLDHIQVNRSSLTFFWDRYIQSFDSRYNGHLGVLAGYLMVELPILDKLRLVGGARYESTDLFVHSESYLKSSITGQETNDTHLAQSDPLPAAGLIYAVTSNMNVRLNYSQTIARPSFRELAAYYGYDPIIDTFIEGNPLLKMTSIKNYDARWEWFPRPGQLLSVSLFYKDLRNAIERGDLKQDGTVITYLNRDQAKLYGIEFEGRENLGFLGAPLSPFTLGGNLALVQSEVKLTAEELFSLRSFFPGASSTRPLYDQSPYILNLDLGYTSRRAGTTASLIFNIAGPRIALTKLNTPDVYEQPAPTLDFVIFQKIGRHTTVKFSAQNLLDPKIERTYGKDSGLLYSSYKKGRTYGLTLSCDF